MSHKLQQYYDNLDETKAKITKRFGFPVDIINQWDDIRLRAWICWLSKKEEKEKLAELLVVKK